MILDDAEFQRLRKGAQNCSWEILVVAIVVCVWPRTWPLLLAMVVNWAAAVLSCFLHVFAHDVDNNKPPR
jgi:hypothetical protein